MKFITLPSIMLSLLLGLGLSACGDDAAQSGECKERCGSLKFFDCFDGLGLAECRAACDNASGEQLETFLQCSRSVTSCDETCWPTFSPVGPGPSQPMCSATSPCASGQFCFNGLCALGCTGDSNCESSQFCDTTDDAPPYFCKNRTVTTCPAVPCASNQECVKGFCSLKETPKTCDSDALGEGRQDGCASNQLCLAPETENGTAQCHAFPPCGKDGVCPTGVIGSTCNDGLITSKDEICLPGLCRETANCPATWNCVLAFGSFGSCSGGNMGELCIKPADCKSNSCMSFGTFGVCTGGDNPFPTDTVEECKESCDDLNFFDCFDGAEKTACRNGCATLSESDRADFISCSERASQCDESCWYWQ